MTDAEINGSSLRGGLKFVKNEYAGGIPRFLERLPEAEKPRFAKPFLAGAWYPYRTYGTFLEHLEAELGDGSGDLVRRFGAYSAEQDAGTGFKIVMVFASIDRLAPKAHTFWPRHCRNAGEFYPVEVLERSVRTALKDFPEMHPLHCRVLQGWFEGMCLVMKANTARTEHTRCIHRGDAECEFHVRWTV